MSKKTVLIAEDDDTTASLIAAYLERDNFAAVIAADGEAALREFQTHAPLLVILDIMLPGIDGWDICRTIRKSSDVPIIMLTARIEEIDRVAGLAMGADDYVVKPFSIRELVERVKAILRRTRPASPLPVPEVLSCGTLKLDPVRRTVTLDGEPLSLTALEYSLLNTFMAAPGRAFSRAELLDTCYQGDIEVVDRVIDVHISKLRQKIEKTPSAPRYIHTIRGFGYRFGDGSDVEGAG
ncbi:DNA-binding response regulator [Geomonas silvestris]|uniref:Phosphate regulon transcriptional regulatory protein PhoB n=1 Tax=Geomonas silvestris TaxID=2740184 RepID=A0A6V8ME66_9BACT|nr:response regulator transcription factor [Geomonas silvestris]GFO58164.1 DNA-binding response regulator [Geomonas silvestris]